MHFYDHPCYYFFQKCLDVTFRILEPMHDDHEPFTLNALDRFHLHTALLKAYVLPQQSLTELHQAIMASGKLPHGLPGHHILKTLTKEAEHFSTLMMPHYTPSFEHLEIHLNFDNICLRGWIKHLCAGALIRYRTSRNKYRLLMRCFIEYLAYCAQVNTPQKAHVFYFSHKNQVNQLTLHPLSQSASIKALQQLILYFEQGHQKPLPFLPSVSINYIMNDASIEPSSTHMLDQEKGYQKLIDALKQERIYARGEYVQRAWPDLLSKHFLTHFMTLAHTLLTPMKTIINIKK